MCGDGLEDFQFNLDSPIFGRWSHPDGFPDEFEPERLSYPEDEATEQAADMQQERQAFDWLKETVPRATLHAISSQARKGSSRMRLPSN
jgi:hypothetical protein